MKLPLLISGESDQDDRPLTFACTSQIELGGAKQEQPLLNSEVNRSVANQKVPEK